MLPLLRTGEVKKMATVVEEIEALVQAAPTTASHEAYVSSVVDGLKLHTLARSDPVEALAFSTHAIHRVQTTVQHYATTNKSVHVLLVAVLFDMLATHCHLLGQQCRYVDFGLGLAQMLQLFASHKSALEPTVVYPYFVAKCHLLIAKVRPGASVVACRLVSCLSLTYVRCLLAWCALFYSTRSRSDA